MLFNTNETWIDVIQENDTGKEWDSFYSTFKYYFNLVCPKIRMNVVKFFELQQEHQKMCTISVCRVSSRSIKMNIKHVNRNTVL
jgi:hypothetical protein